MVLEPLEGPILEVRLSEESSLLVKPRKRDPNLEKERGEDKGLEEMGWWVMQGILIEAIFGVVEESGSLLLLQSHFSIHMCDKRVLNGNHTVPATPWTMVCQSFGFLSYFV